MIIAHKIINNNRTKISKNARNAVHTGTDAPNAVFAEKTENGLVAMRLGTNAQNVRANILQDRLN